MTLVKMRIMRVAAEGLKVTIAITLLTLLPELQLLVQPQLLQITTATTITALEQLTSFTTNNNYQIFRNHTHHLLKNKSYFF